MPKQILLADDSATIGKIVQLTFAHEDAVVTAVKSGDEALARARDSRPDIVLVDASMPGKSGYDVCAELRSSGVDVPVLILTGNFSPYDEGKGKSAGADGNVVKPFETQALIDRVNQLIGQRSSGKPVSAAPAATTNKIEPAPAPPPAAKPAPAPAAAASPPPPLKPLSNTATLPPAMVKPAVAAPKPAAPPPRATLMGIPTVNPAGMPVMGPPSYTPAPPQVLPPTRNAPQPPPAVQASTVIDMPAPVIPPPVIAAPPAPAPPPRVEPPPPAPPPVIAAPPPPVVRAPDPPPPAPAPPPVVAAPPPVARAPEPRAPEPPPARPLRPSLIPHAPTPQPRPHADDFEYDERTRKVDNYSIPRQARPDSHSPMAEAVAREAAPRVVEALGGAAMRGPEYEALTKLSREVIEQIVWEVVPDLAESIIKAELDRLVKERQRGA